ncbi:MAG: hypothetical protein WC246_02330 [Candidatus Paceibacterota bacterium]|jgi:hypothetical protein
MENNESKNFIKEKVIAAIASGRVTMRPRWHFVLRAFLLALGVALSALALLYVGSFIAFTLRQTGILFAPGFGSRGWFALFRSLPWLLIGIAALFLAVLEILVRRYAFAHREPLVYVTLGILAIAIGGSVIIIPLQRAAFRAAHGDQMPFPGQFYRTFGAPRLPDVVRGTVVSRTTDAVVIDDPNGTRVTIAIASDTRMAPFDMGFGPGDTVVVFGRQNDAGVIRAEGIRVDRW